jgi:hypothetical protein
MKTNQNSEKILSYSIIRTELTQDQKKESGLKVLWGKSLAELTTGEYLLTYSPCSGDICFEIRAYSVMYKQSEFIVRMEGKDVSFFTFHEEYFIFSGWDNPNSIEIVDLFRRTNYSMKIGGKHAIVESLRNSDWLLIASDYIKNEYFINLRESKMGIMSKMGEMIQYTDFIIRKDFSSNICKPILITKKELKVVPINISCDDKMLSWRSSSGGKWLWRITFDKQKQEGTFDIIPAECILEHLDDVGFCESLSKTVFYVYSEPDCGHSYHWTPDDNYIILLKEDGIVPCKSKGARLINLDGQQSIIKNYPIYLYDIWTSDGKWVVWESSIIDDWGLFSPYSGGELKKFGENKIYDYAIYKTPGE